MSYYELSKEERTHFFQNQKKLIKDDLQKNKEDAFLKFAQDNDTYIRKNAYLILSRLYLNNEELKINISNLIKNNLTHENEKVRQTLAYALGEIGKIDFDIAKQFLPAFLEDEHHSVRNGVIGALKRAGRDNPDPTLAFIEIFLTHSNPEIRREMVHGMELLGRTHPEKILPLLKKIQWEDNTRVFSMIIHVIGQICYKKGCVEKVLEMLKNWENKELIGKALLEMIHVHQNYEKFSEKSIIELRELIAGFFPEFRMLLM